MPDVATTLGLPAGQRFEYWKHVLSHPFVPLEVSTPGGGADVQGRLRGCDLGSLRFIEVLAEAAPAGCCKIGLQRLDCAPPSPDVAHRALMLQITAFVEARLGEAELSPAEVDQGACAGMPDVRSPVP